MKERRREFNEMAKARRNAATNEQKARQAEQKRAAQGQQLMMLVKPVTKSQ
jgi:hypothetical protein